MPWQSAGPSRLAVEGAIDVVRSLSAGQPAVGQTLRHRRFDRALLEAASSRLRTESFNDHPKLGQAFELRVGLLHNRRRRKTIGGCRWTYPGGRRGRRGWPDLFGRILG